MSVKTYFFSSKLQYGGKRCIIGYSNAKKIAIISIFEMDLNRFSLFSKKNRSASVLRASFGQRIFFRRQRTFAFAPSLFLLKKHRRRFFGFGTKKVLCYDTKKVLWQRMFFFAEIAKIVRKEGEDSFFERRIRFASVLKLEEYSSGLFAELRSHNERSMVKIDLRDRISRISYLF